MRSYMIKVVRVGAPQLSLKFNESGIGRCYWDSVIKRQSWFDENKEHLIVVLLSTQLQIEGYSLVSIGTLSESLAHPREIFRAAVAGGCYGIVLMHNHPSGDPSPSEIDQSLTRRIAEAGGLLQVKVFDHIIIGQLEAAKAAQERQRVKRRGRRARRGIEHDAQDYYSFAEAGML